MKCDVPVHLADEHDAVLCQRSTPAKLAVTEGELDAVIRTGGGLMRERALGRRIKALKAAQRKAEQQPRTSVVDGPQRDTCEACVKYLEKFPQCRNVAFLVHQREEAARISRIAEGLKRVG